MKLEEEVDEGHLQCCFVNVDAISDLILARNSLSSLNPVTNPKRKALVEIETALVAEPGPKRRKEERLSNGHILIDLDEPEYDAVIVPGPNPLVYAIGGPGVIRLTLEATPGFTAATLTDEMMDEMLRPATDRIDSSEYRMIGKVILDIDLPSVLHSDTIDVAIDRLPMQVKSIDENLYSLFVSDLIVVTSDNPVFLSLINAAANVRITNRIVARTVSRLTLEVHVYSKPNLTPDDEKWFTDFFDAFYPCPGGSFDLMGDILPSAYRKIRSQPDSVTTPLMEFQRKAMSWMIDREAGCIMADKDDCGTFGFWECLNSTLYLNRLTGCFVFDKSHIPKEPLVEGGILADEMGLGKTIVALSLILTSPPPPGFKPPDLDKSCRFTKATLIIIPKAIKDQWGEEIEKHVKQGKLSVFIYEYSTNRDVDFSEYDIVLTTFDQVRKEIWLARDEPDRSRRKERKYSRPKSPLKTHYFWRLIMDEAQMVDDAKSSLTILAEMCRLIPAIKHWGISGTPISKTGTVADLRYLISLLGIEPWLEAGIHEWKTLSQKHPDLVKSRLALFMHRTMKSSVKEDLFIPKQHNHIVMLNFECVPQAYYDNLVDQLRHEANVGTNPAHRVEKLIGVRPLLLQLRQACCHPQVGTHNKRLLGANLRSMDALLDLMLAQARAFTMSVDYDRILKATDLALTYDSDGSFSESLPLHLKRVEEIMQTIQKLKEPVDANATNEINNQQIGAVGEDAVDDGVGGKSNKRKIQTWEELLHRIYYHLANAYYTLYSHLEAHELHRDSATNLTTVKCNENQQYYYDEANNLRQNVLRSHVIRFTEECKASAEKFHEVSEQFRDKTRENKGYMFVRLVDPEGHPLRGGIKTADIFDSINSIYERLNSQWMLIKDWRRELRLLAYSDMDLTSAEEGEDASPTGNEYAVHLEVQENISAYYNALNDIINDRDSLIHGSIYTSKQNFQSGSSLPTQLFNSRKRLELRKDIKEKCLNALIKDVRAIAKDKDNTRQPNADVIEIEDVTDDEPDCVITETRMPKSSKSLKKLPDFKEKKSKVNTLKQSRQMEAEVAKIALSCLERQLEFLKAKLAVMKSEIPIFGKIIGIRDRYFYELSKFNEGVNPPNFPSNLVAHRQILKSELQAIEHKLTQAIGRMRYFENLKTTRDPLMMNDECPICKDHYSRGVVVECGHLHCANCYKNWTEVQLKCAVCAQHIDPESTVRITTKYFRKSAEDLKPEASAEDIDLLEKTKTININGSYGTKIDAVVRHVMYIKENLNEKVIIFSQWEALLSIVAQALTSNNVKNESLTKGALAVSIFQKNADVTALMLNARSQASGLTLTQAKHVFILEPVLDRALERQAIGRVHRIGQTSETHVWRYMIKDTLESMLYEMGQRPTLYRHGKLESKVMGGGEHITNEQLQEIIDAIKY